MKFRNDLPIACVLITTHLLSVCCSFIVAHLFCCSFILLLIPQKSRLFDNFIHTTAYSLWLENSGMTWYICFSQELSCKGDQAKSEWHFQNQWNRRWKFSFCVSTLSTTTFISVLLLSMNLICFCQCLGWGGSVGCVFPVQFVIAIIKRTYIKAFLFWHPVNSFLSLAAEAFQFM